MSTTVQRKRTPILAWPFILLWKIVTWFVNLTGIMVGLLLGFVFMVLGFFLTMTVIGAIVGIPLFIVGFMIALRALY